MAARISTAPLDILIIGASIAGIACAFTLQSAGHNVTVVEQCDALSKGCGPVRSPPNMTKLVEQWGLGDEFKRTGVVSSLMSFLNGMTDEFIGKQVFHPSIMHQFGGDVVVIQHGALLELLYSHAVEEGASVRFGCKVVQVDASNGVVLLESGERLKADLIVGADGVDGVTQEVVLGEKPFGERDDRYHYCFSLPLSEIEADPDLRFVTEGTNWRIWMGDRCFLQACAVDPSGQLLCFMKAPTRYSEDFPERWDSAQPLDADNLILDGLGPTPRKLISMAREAVPTLHVVYDPFENWVHEGYKVVLVGSAAHPQASNGSQSIAMTIEDAETLGNLFSRLHDRAHLPLFLTAYEEIRQSRAAETQYSERAGVEFMCLPPSDPLRPLRDAGMRAALAADVAELDDADSPTVAQAWLAYAKSWGHDAGEAVDDWWSIWRFRFEQPRAGAEEVHLQVPTASTSA